MNQDQQRQEMPASGGSELAVLPDGEILVHNLTPALAALLSELNRGDPLMLHRAQSWAGSEARPATDHQPRATNFSS